MADHDLNASTFAARVAASTVHPSPPRYLAAFAPCQGRATVALAKLSSTFCETRASWERKPRCRAGCNGITCCRALGTTSILREIPALCDAGRS